MKRIDDPIPKCLLHYQLEIDYYLNAERLLLKKFIEYNIFNLNIIRYGFISNYIPNSFISKSSSAVILLVI